MSARYEAEATGPSTSSAMPPGTSGETSWRADRNCDETSPRIETRPPRSEPPRIRSGRNPSRPRQVNSPPRARIASNKGDIGRLAHPGRAVQNVTARDRGEESGEKAPRRPGVADIHTKLRVRVAAPANPPDHPPSHTFKENLHSELPERRRERAGVRRIQRVEERALAVRTSGCEERAVRDALAAGRADGSGQPSAGEAPRAHGAAAASGSASSGPNPRRRARSSVSSCTIESVPSGAISACLRSSSHAGRTCVTPSGPANVRPT